MGQFNNQMNFNFSNEVLNLLSNLCAQSKVETGKSKQMQ